MHLTKIIYAQTANFSILFSIKILLTFHNKHFPHNLFVQKFSSSVAES